MQSRLDNLAIAAYRRFVDLESAQPAEPQIRRGGDRRSEQGIRRTALKLRYKRCPDETRAIPELVYLQR